jgi:hypothetical protein
MTSKIINTEFLDSFNLDGTTFDKPVEKIKQDNLKITEHKKLIRNFVIIGIITHLLHYLIFLNPEPIPQIQSHTFEIPKGFGQINLPANLTTDLNRETTKIKILDRSYKKTLAKGYIRKSENTKAGSDQNRKYRFYIPYNKFEKILIESNKGIVIAPYEMTIQKKESYEIKI